MALVSDVAFQALEVTSQAEGLALGAAEFKSTSDEEIALVGQYL